MQIAVIDCGTNTFNLLIVEANPVGDDATVGSQKFRRLFHTRVPVKLGEGTINNNMIAPVAFERGINALVDFHRIIQQYAVSHISALATSAIRDASNGDLFIERVKKLTGMDIRKIDGETEALLISYGIKEAVPMDDKLCLIMDIGGGSTEFIIANATDVKWKRSFNIGAARLLARFKPSDPITEEERAAIGQHLEQELQELDEAMQLYRPTILIGSSGAFESVLEIWHARRDHDFSIESSMYEMDIEQYNEVANVIRQSTISERSQMKGLVAMRVDMIVIFCLKVDHVINKYGFNGFKISTYSLKEGAAVDIISKLNK